MWKLSVVREDELLVPSVDASVKSLSAESAFRGLKVSISGYEPREAIESATHIFLSRDDTERWGILFPEINNFKHEGNNTCFEESGVFSRR